VFGADRRVLSRFRAALVLTGVVALHVVDALAVPPGFQQETLITGLSRIVNLQALPDGRMLVLRQSGRIHIFDPAVQPVLTATYLELTDIQTSDERGLASMTLDPDFQNNGYIYVYYTHASTNRNRISRFTHLGDTADIGSEVLIWQDNEDVADRFHYGGGLDFGPDGRLYLTTGEEFEGA
jgi:glucose/arabinose dehydrogenase